VGQGRFDPATFSTEVVSIATQLVPMTVSLWNKVQVKMLPTPAKFHYLFNMRELSKVRICAALLLACLLCACYIFSCFMLYVIHQHLRLLACQLGVARVREE
jgi:hypothetical protein